VVLLLIALVLLALPAPALASKTQETVLQDDPKIVFPASPSALDHTMSMLQDLGVDRIRVSVIWELFGPDSKSRERPAFDSDPGDPASYDDGAWGRYDGIVRQAAEHDLGVLFNVTVPGPHWATKLKPGGVFPHYVEDPDPRAFSDFMEALGRRYDGSFPDPQRGKTGAALPRVDHWSIWNEPNYPSWLWPQYRRVRGVRGRVPNSPRLYRRLVDAAYAGLKRAGHEDDTILLGETAPGGAGGKGLTPLPFIRELYCLDRRFQPYSGRAARVRSCPTTAASRAAFPSYHPALFRTSGWAHHAYSLYFPPTYHHPDRNAVTIGDIPRLTKTLDRASLRWGEARKPDVWVTEHGYQTKPPDPYARVSPRRQADWITWADFRSYLNPRVASVAQFLLYDDRPRAKYQGQRKKRRIYWGTWQSGLLTADGARKPAFDAYRLPLWIIPRRTAGARPVRVWAQYRPCDASADLTARIEFLASGTKSWQTLTETSVSNEDDVLDTKLDLPGTGAVRVVWVDPAKEDAQPTRALGVRVRP
jgi:hypothetical protein